MILKQPWKKDIHEKKTPIQATAAAHGKPISKVTTSFKLSAESSAESLPVIYPRPPTQKLRLGTRNVLYWSSEFSALYGKFRALSFPYKEGAELWGLLQCCMGSEKPYILALLLLNLYCILQVLNFGVLPRSSGPFPSRTIIAWSLHPVDSVSLGQVAKIEVLWSCSVRHWFRRHKLSPLRWKKQPSLWALLSPHVRHRSSAQSNCHRQCI